MRHDMSRGSVRGTSRLDVQGFSVTDGPGCRTIGFLQGCPLRCNWCANPEGIDPHPVPLLMASTCDLCGDCAGACPYGAVSADGPAVAIDRDICAGCETFPCVNACSRGALEIAGYEVELDQLMRILQRDRRYWGASGGVTLTGGEPLFQRSFATQLLRRCSESYIHTAVETCGYAAWPAYADCLPHLDWNFFDIKHVDDDRHLGAAGRSNDLILSNARRLAESFDGRLVFRTPVIPGLNDSDRDMRDLADFVAHLPRPDLEINLLPIHHYSREKYRKLGQAYPMPDLSIPTPEQLARAAQVFDDAGVTCYVGSETPF